MATREDVIVMNTVTAATKYNGQSNYPIRTAANTLYVFFMLGDNNDLYYTKSTNGGITWDTQVTVRTGTVVGVSTWFDKWTKDDTGTVIHVAYTDSGTNTIYYRALDTNGDTLGSEITVNAITSVVAGGATCLSITKSKAGRILVAYDGDGGTETGFFKSNDFPVTAFSTKDNTLHEGASDYYMLFPGNYADTADIDALFWDRSANLITLKTYDDSGNTWSESASFGTTFNDLISTTAAPQFAAAQRNSDGHLIVVAWTDADLATASFKCYDVNGSGSITAKTDVIADPGDDQAMCAIGIDTDSDTLYVFYCGSTDGLETAYTSLNVYYKTSTDGGTNWGSETLLSNSGARPVNGLWTCPEFSGGEFVTVWDYTTVTVNSRMNSALVPESGGGGGMRLAGHGGLAA